MWPLFIIFPLISACFCEEELVNNTIWISNENILTTLDKIYDNLPRSTIQHTKYEPKRAFAVVSELVLQYTTSNDSSPLDTVQKLVKILQEPADVIGADPRKDLDTLRSLIDQPINDIKRACKPATTSMECVNKLYFYQQQQKDKCPKYENHQKLRDVTEKITEDVEFQKLLSDAIHWSTSGNDELAVAFFVYAVSNHESLFKRLRKNYASAALDYPCIKTGAFDS